MRPALPAALITLLLPAGLASAQSRVIETGSRTPVNASDLTIPPHLSGPFLAGDDVIWAERRRRQGTRAIVVDGPPGRRVVDRTRDNGRIFNLAGGEGRLALITYAMECPPEDPVWGPCRRYMQQTATKQALRVGPIGGPLTSVDDPGCPISASVAASAVGLQCDRFHLGRDQVVENDGTRREYDPSGGNFEVAGDLVAFAVVGGGVVVQRRSTGEELLRVGAAGYRFDLAPDGTIAYMLPGGVGWSSPSEPDVHRIETPFQTYQLVHVRLAGGRIAVGANTSESGSRIMVFERDGRVATDVDLVGREFRLDQANWDFDGRRLAWFVRPCARSYVVVWDLGEPFPAVPQPGCGEIGIATRRGAAIVGNRLRFGLVCKTPAPNGCAGVFEAILSTRRGDATRESYLPAPSGRTTFDADPGLNWRELLPLRRADRRALRRASDAWLTVRINSGGREEAVHRLAVRRLTRR